MESLAKLDFQPFLLQLPAKLMDTLEANLALRMDHPTETEKFYPTEQAIHEMLAMFDQKLEDVDEEPQRVLEMLIESKIFIPLLKALEHPNADVNIAGVNVFHSLVIDMNSEIEQAEQAKEGEVHEAFPVFFRVVNWLWENGLVEGLFGVVGRLEEERIEEYEGCRRVLKLLEFLLQMCESSYQTLVRDTKIIPFIANRILPNFTISHRIIDDNKFIASDLLLALLQTPEVEPGLSAVRQLFECCGVEVLVTTISCYQSKLPTQIDERQFLSNLFDCLNMLLVSIRESRLQLHQLRGVYLMVTYICNKTEYALTALKIACNSLDNELPEEVLRAVCEEIVNDGSLKYFFPILMGQGVKGKDEDEQKEINENILGVLYFLVRNSAGVARDRVLYKFAEKRFSKLERVVELRMENSPDLSLRHHELSAEAYLKTIQEEGLIPELCDKIILTLWDSSSKMRAKIPVFLSLFALPVAVLSASMNAHYKFIDPGQEKQYIEKVLLSSLRQMREAIGITSEESAKKEKEEEGIREEGDGYEEEEEGRKKGENRENKAEKQSGNLDKNGHNRS